MEKRHLCLMVLLTFFSLACGQAGEGESGSNLGSDTQSTQSAQTSSTSAQLEWIREVDAEAAATTRGIGADGTVYVGGQVNHALDGFEDGRASDGFVRAFDADGNELWTDQIILAQVESVRDVVVDSTGVYAVGAMTQASARFGERTQTFVRKYSFAGDVLWTSLYGIDVADVRITTPYDAAADDTGIYITGTAGSTFAPSMPTVPFDAFVIKIDSQGQVVWSTTLGDAEVDDEARGITVNAEGVFIAGSTAGALAGETNAGGEDAFVAHLGSDGGLIWADQFGSTADDAATGIASSNGRIHLSGYALGALEGQTHMGQRDGFVRTYGTDGSVQWTDQFGTADDDSLWNAIDADMSGVYVVGGADGSLTDEGSQEAAPTVRKYDVGGQVQWTFQFSAPFASGATSVEVDDDAVYVGGFSYVAKIVESSDDDGDDGDDEPAECETVEGDVIIDGLNDAGTIGGIEGCFDIAGHLFIQDADDIEDLAFLSGLRSVQGFVGIADNVGLTSLAGLDDLESVGEGVVIEGNPDLQSVRLASLQQVEGVIHIFGDPSLERIELGSLVSAGELLIAANDALLTVSAPQLVSIDMRLLIENNEVLHTVDLSSLQDVGSIQVRFNPALDRIDAPLLQ